jgi:hypothetical protein
MLVNESILDRPACQASHYDLGNSLCNLIDFLRGHAAPPSGDERKSTPSDFDGGIVKSDAWIPYCSRETDVDFSKTLSPLATADR